MALHGPHAARRMLARALPLGGPPGELLEMAAGSQYRDLLACGASVVGATALVKSFKLLASNGVLDQVPPLILIPPTPKPCMHARLNQSRARTGSSGRLLTAASPCLVPPPPAQKFSRKLVHMTSGPLFVLAWVLYR